MFLFGCVPVNHPSLFYDSKLYWFHVGENINFRLDSLVSSEILFWRFVCVCVLGIPTHVRIKYRKFTLGHFWMFAMRLWAVRLTSLLYIFFKRRTFITKMNTKKKINKIFYCCCCCILFRRYGTKCSGCGLGIAPSELVRKPQDKVFHLNCFSCYSCKRQLSTGDHLYVVGDNKFLCKEDYFLSKHSSLTGECWHTFPN